MVTLFHYELLRYEHINVERAIYWKKKYIERRVILLYTTEYTVRLKKMKTSTEKLIMCTCVLFIQVRNVIITSMYGHNVTVFVKRGEKKKVNIKKCISFQPTVSEFNSTINYHDHRAADSNTYAFFLMPLVSKTERPTDRPNEPVIVLDRHGQRMKPTTKNKYKLFSWLYK